MHVKQIVLYSKPEKQKAANEDSQYLGATFWRILRDKAVLSKHLKSWQEVCTYNQEI